MVNNAGIACVTPIADHAPEEWDRVMNLTLPMPEGRGFSVRRSLPPLEGLT
jgi:NAD(P)-dependent dehydrogenase (short-subunit alcohol dehydrogenase family)